MNRLSCDFSFILVVEWEYLTKHKIRDDSKRPDVDFFAVRFLHQDLWRYIGQGAERISATFVRADDFAETKIHNLAASSIAVVFDKNVFWL